MVAPDTREHTEDTESGLPDPYELVSIRAVPAPGGAAGSTWHRYEITQGRNRIVGYRDGGIDNVTLAVQAIVLGLNDRRRQRRGRVDVVLQPSSRAAKPSAGE